jgi:hypothetical protein
MICNTTTLRNVSVDWRRIQLHTLDYLHNKNYREFKLERVIPHSAGGAVAVQGENGRSRLTPSRYTAHFVYTPLFLPRKSVERQVSLTCKLWEGDGYAAADLSRKY